MHALSIRIRYTVLNHALSKGPFKLAHTRKELICALSIRMLRVRIKILMMPSSLKIKI
jgi:hypothetical protein